MSRNIIAASIGLIAAFLTAACGGDDETKPGQKYGALDVQVLAVHSADAPEIGDVARIEIVLDGALDYETSLVESAADVWTGRFERAVVGDYVAVARAYDAADELIFASEQNPVSIGKGSNPQLTIVLNQRAPDGAFRLPYFTSIVLDRTAVDQGQPVAITVAAAGGTDPLTLSGRFAHGVTPDPETTGSFTTAPFVDGTAQIVWTAPFAQGAHWFVLVVTDAEGNVAEMGVTVVVGSDRGTIDVGVEFNLAPELSVITRGLVDAEGTHLYFQLSATDATPGPMSWELLDDPATGGCGGALTAASLAALQDPWLSPVTRFAEYHAPLGTADCKVTFVVTDALGASVREEITVGDVVVPPNETAPTTWSFRDVVAGVATEFSIEPTLISTWPGTNPLRIRLGLYSFADDGFLPDFARYADPSYGGADAYPLTLATAASGYAWVGPEIGYMPGTFTAANAPTWWFELEPLTAGRYVMVIEFIDAATGQTLAGDDHWFFAN